MRQKTPGFWEGPYPGSLDPIKAEQKLSDLLSLGVVVFVDLMEDEEFNEKTEASYKPYWDLLSRLAQKKGVDVHREQFHIPDQNVPESQDKMLEILDFINSYVENGKLVYVHCAGGHGRTGTVAGCWGMCRGNMPPVLDIVLKSIKAKRNHDSYLSGYASPETKYKFLFFPIGQIALNHFSERDLRNVTVENNVIIKDEPLGWTCEVLETKTKKEILSAISIMRI